MSKDRPNIIFIMTDQQSATMMSCAGNRYINTPAMDSIAERGIRFECSYAANPVCVPSRFSLFTGRMPSMIGMKDNSSKHIESIPDEIKTNGMGWLLRKAGYETVYAGKQHLPKMNAEDLGFSVLTKDERDECADICAQYLLKDHNKPFCLVCSLINPHDICYMAIRDFPEDDFSKILIKKGEKEIAELEKALRLPEGISEEEFYERFCPPLPANFEKPADEPSRIQDFLDSRSFKAHARAKWTPRQWRMHRWAYKNLTERVDAQIQIVLDALRENDLEKDTVIIFTSDHGDHDSSRRMEHKSVPYDTAARVPMLLSYTPEVRAGIVDRTTLTCNGLDLIPTICDFAEAKVPDDLKGKSLRRIAAGDEITFREALCTESETGRMVRTPQYKYIISEYGENREQLFDMQNDPDEIQNLIKRSSLRDVIREHRKYLAAWIDEIDDCIGREYVPSTEIRVGTEAAVTNRESGDGGSARFRQTGSSG
jgi:choline-sulfatase